MKVRLINSSWWGGMGKIEFPAECEAEKNVGEGFMVPISALRDLGADKRVWHKGMMHEAIHFYDECVEVIE